MLKKSKPIIVTAENYQDLKKDLRLYLAGEIGKYLNYAGSCESLSNLLNRSKLYVRTIINRKASIEKLEKLLTECQGKVKI